MASMNRQKTTNMMMRMCLISMVSPCVVCEGGGCGLVDYAELVWGRTAVRIKGPMAHRVRASNRISIRYTAE